MERKTKIAVDLDGTISEYPEFFKLFTKAMSQAGCRIYILTGPAAVSGSCRLRRLLNRLRL